MDDAGVVTFGPGQVSPKRDDGSWSRLDRVRTRGDHEIRLECRSHQWRRPGNGRRPGGVRLDQICLRLLMRFLRSVLAGPLLGVSLVACNSVATPSSSSLNTTQVPQSTTTEASATTTTTTAVSTTAQSPLVVVLEEPGEIDSAWMEALVLPYGDDEEHLGTSPGGDGEGIMWGPNYGVQMPDGTWWFLDSARLRLAHFSEEGFYLGEAVVPTAYLAQGRYFQFQMPQVLTDGTIAISNPTAGSLLLFDGSDFTQVGLSDPISVKNTDGALLYGFSGVEMVQANPSTGAVEFVERFASPAGDEYSILVTGSSLHVTISEIEEELPVVWGSHPEAEVYPALEVKSDASGTLHVFIFGFVEEVPGEITELAGYFTIDRAFTVSAVDSMRSPFSASDPGSPAHLGLGPGETPWLMFVDTDAVRVFRREG